MPVGLVTDGSFTAYMSVRLCVMLKGTYPAAPTIILVLPGIDRPAFSVSYGEALSFLR